MYNKKPFFIPGKVAAGFLYNLQAGPGPLLVRLCAPVITALILPLYAVFVPVVELSRVRLYLYLCVIKTR
jgi:hypothetical protein